MIALMPKRKLVEITPEQHERVELIRAKLKKAGKRVPSVPFLVQLAFDKGIGIATFELTQNK